MTKKDSGYYLVKEDILPSAIKKTIKVKEMLRRHDNMTINDAVSKMGLSRSAYYKYKDFVLPFYEASINKIVSVSFVLDNKQGVLSNVLNMISEDKGNVLTIKPRYSSSRSSSSNKFLFETKKYELLTLKHCSINCVL